MSSRLTSPPRTSRPRDATSAIRSFNRFELKYLLTSAQANAFREDLVAGLGLAIVREVVSSHDGEVEIVETPGGGATVRISLSPAG